MLSRFTYGLGVPWPAMAVVLGVVGSAVLPAGHRFTESVALEPKRIVDVNIDPEAMLFQLLPIRNGLIGLESSRYTTPMLLRLDGHANETGLFKLPAGEERRFAQRIATDGLDEIALLERMSPQSRKVIVFDLSQNVKKTMEFDFTVQDLALMGGNVFAIADDQLLELPEKRKIADLEPPGPWLLIAVGPTTLGAVNATSMELDTIEIPSGAKAAHKVRCPEIEKAIEQNAGYSNAESAALLLSTLAGDGSGFIYAGLSPWPADAAQLIAFDKNGSVVRSLRLHMPEAPTVPRSGKTYSQVPVSANLSPTAIAVSREEQELLVYSQMHNKIAVFDLDAK